MQSNSLGIPIAIVIAAALIAGAIYLSGTRSVQTDETALQNSGEQEQITPEITIEPITENDHIRGNPNAPILLVEYSDYDCPFCKNFHATMQRVMDEYGADGKVAWVYRHFPLQQLHPNAPTVAAAAECVAELGGNDAFWVFTDLVFGERGTNEPTDLTRLSEFAGIAGVENGKFEACTSSGKYNQAIEEDLAEAIAAGGRGTPHTVVMVGNQKGTINGAQPYANVKQIIDQLLAQIEGGTITDEEEGSS